ncbi:MAG: adenylyl-sulfate kinase, partial [Rhodobacteraceae bacterium]|nr:adenylyl-sulfate kinase [Paracoccaceae bacterium]
MGEPAEPGFPRVRRHHRLGCGAAGRCGARSAVGQDLDRGADRQLRWRQGCRGGGRIRHADAGRRDRLLARAGHHRVQGPAGSVRPVRGRGHLDGRARDGAGPCLLDEDRRADRVGQGRSAEIRGERQHPGTSGGQDAGPERDRRGNHHHRPRDPVRALCGKPGSGRVHPDRQDDQCDRGGGDHPLLVAPGTEHPLAGHRHQPRASRVDEAPEAGRGLADRPVLSGSGKSTIANALERKLARMNRHTFLLDGDNVRHGLNKDLGFTEADRVENVRRVGEVAKLMTDAGLIVVTAFISPFRSERDMVRGMMQPGEFIEVFVDTPLSVAEQRDVKGLYAKARSGQLKNFTGIDSPYEAPENAEIRIDTTAMTPDEAADRII